jgi:hypothetical protein
LKEKEKENNPLQPQTNIDRKEVSQNASIETPTANASTETQSLKNEETKKEDDTSGYAIVESGLGINE